MRFARQVLVGRDGRYLMCRIRDGTATDKQVLQTRSLALFMTAHCRKES